MKAFYAFLGTLTAAASLGAGYRMILAFTQKDLSEIQYQTEAFASVVALALFLAFSLSCFRSAFPGKTSEPPEPSQLE